ncbi:hypothetical protein ACFRMN_05070 [Streptomyces sp. NPDC056835]|uniref:hypothetical protein n=1 Tax=Streptomyces sp. NPDC056835 TaxID=3345956 RepID=UPI003690C53D
MSEARVKGLVWTNRIAAVPYGDAPLPEVPRPAAPGPTPTARDTGSAPDEIFAAPPRCECVLGTP